MSTTNNSLLVNHNPGDTMNLLSKSMAVIAVTVLTPILLFAQQVELPISKSIITMPEKFDVYEMDLGAPFGKSDVIMDESKDKVISFMVINDKIKDTDELIAGLKSGLKKQKAIMKESVVEINKIKVSVLGAKIGGKDQVDKRVYVFLPKQQLIILSQSGFDSFNDDKILKKLSGEIVK